jgi:hypothetical protein
MTVPQRVQSDVPSPRGVVLVCISLETSCSTTDEKSSISAMLVPFVIMFDPEINNAVSALYKTPINLTIGLINVTKLN